MEMKLRAYQQKFIILCNAELFGEGFDVPNMDAVILVRHTKSLTNIRCIILREIELYNSVFKNRI